MNSMKRQKDRTLKDELPRSVGAQYATGDKQRKNLQKEWLQSPSTVIVEPRKIYKIKSATVSTLSPIYLP